MNDQRKQALSLVAILMAAAGLLAGGILLQRRTELRRKAVYSNIDVSLHPQPLEVCKGDQAKLLVKVDPSPENAAETAEIHAAEIRLNFDNEIAAVSKVTFHDDYGASIWNEDKANNSGVLKMAALTMAQSVPTEVFDLVEVEFSGEKEGEFELRLDSDYEIRGVRGQTDADVDRELEINNVDQIVTQVKVVDCDGEGEADWPKMTFKIRFVGTEYEASGKEIVVSNIPDQKVDIVIKGQGQRKVFENVNVSFDEQAIGTGSLELVGVTPGSGYTILIKGPVHLARRFCEDEQVDRCWLGQGNLTITSGENVFDWTALALEPGDINRDGIVDATDYTKLKAALGQSGEAVQEDLNRNGTVTGQDVVFFLETLSKRYEEEI